MAKEITNEMFDERLSEIIDRNPASRLLSIAGIYEILREEFNNEILSELEFDYDNPDDIDGADDEPSDAENAEALRHWNHFISNHAPMVIKQRPKDWAPGEAVVIVPVVNQSFVIAAMLTVKEAMEFCSRMRLPVETVIY